MWHKSETMPNEWWEEIKKLDDWGQSYAAADQATNLTNNEIHGTAILDTSEGAILLGRNIKICEGVTLKGPLVIGDNTIIGKNAQVRGPSIIGNDVLLGFNVEVKRSVISSGCKLGPGSYVGDSFLQENVFLGALVRTSNFRLDGKNVEVIKDGRRYDSGMDKLGCLIGTNTSLGIGCKIYPGREVPPHSLFEMDVHIKKNLSPGHFRIKQDLERVD